MPLITNVNPDNATIEGGVTVRITGLLFHADAKVRIGGANATVLPSSTPPTVLDVTVPAHALGEQVQLVVRNPDNSSSSAPFYYCPLISKVDPDTGAIGGGTAVTIEGEGFQAGMTVELANTPAAGVNVVSATRITCTTPAYAAAVAATVPLDVLLPVAVVQGRRDSFTYEEPMITSVDPRVLPLAGGNVTVRGRFFTGATAATVDLAVLVPTVNSDTEIVLAAPAHLAGTVPISITGGVAGTLANALTYAGAKITAVTPNRGPANQATTVRITGERFAGVPAVTIGGNNAVPTAATATTIDVDAPVHIAGKVPVVVTNAGEPPVTLPDGFTFVAQPVITAVKPSVGLTSVGTAITVTGTGFEPTVRVRIGGDPADVGFLSPTTLTVIARPHDAETVDVEAANPDGVSGTLNACFTYTDLTSVEPNRGATAGGTVVTINGAGFSATDAVSFGGTAAAAVNFVNATRLTVTTPQHDPGLVDVVVGAKTLTDAFTFSAVTKIDPVEGPLAGRQVTIEGEGFGAGMRVTFGGNPGANVNVTSATSLTVDAPVAAAAGPVDVVVERETQFANAFTFYDPVVVAGGAAAFTAILPNAGRTAGGTPVLVRGVGFGDDATVWIGNNQATVNARSANEISAVTPQGAAAAAVRVEVRWSAPLLGAALLGGPPVMVGQDAAFTYRDVMAVEPAAGPAAGGTVVTITGDGFGPDLRVTFGQPGTNVTIDSATQVRATTPAGAGTVNVVTKRAGRATAGFTYYGAAQIASIEPEDALATGGRTVIIRGQGFCLTPTVTIGGTAVTHLARHSDTTLQARAGNHGVAAAGVDTVVTNPNTAAATLNASFTYRAAATVTAVAPLRGPIAGGRWITLACTDLVRGAKVLVDNAEIPAGDTVYTNAQMISVRVPAHDAGQVDVAVQNPGEAVSAPLVNGFEYVVTPAETGQNGALFLMDGEEYFTELQTLMNAVRAAAPDPLTYVRMAFWWAEPAVTLSDYASRDRPQHRLLVYIDQVIRAGHHVDIILWEPGTVEQVQEMTGQVRESNIEFGLAVKALDDAVAGMATAGRARVYHERYEGPLGSSTHQKIAIFSIAGQRTAVLGGLNLGREYLADTDHLLSRWHDAGVRLIGPITDDIETEWVRRWKKTATAASSRLLKAFGAAGLVRARRFAFTADNTVRAEAVRLQENTTRQTPHADNRTVTIATTRADGTTRYRQLRDLLLEKIAAATQFIYMENYHFTDPEIVRAIYRRHDVLRLGGIELRIVVFVPDSGGGSGYLTRRSWLQFVLRLRHAGGYYATQVHYDLGAGARTVDPTLCNLWTVRDSYDRNEAGDWFEKDQLRFRLAAGGGEVAVPFTKITSVEGTLHFYTSFNMVVPRVNVYNHSKIAIIDDFLVVGSANWSYRSMQYDGEISAFIDSNPLAAGALARLLGHYDRVTALNVNNVEAEATNNLDALAGANPVRLNLITLAPNKHIVVPLCAHNMPGLALPVTPPTGLQNPGYTWL